MIRCLKLLILAAVLAVPFLPRESRLTPGSKAFAIHGYPTGTRLVVLRDDDLDPSTGRLVAVRVDTGKLAGEIGEIHREDMQPIVFTIGGAK